MQLLLIAGKADAADLRAADNGQQVEFVKGAGRFCEGKAETLAQCAFGQVHFENRKQAEGHAPGFKPHRHRYPDRALGRHCRQARERAAALALAVE